MRERRQICIRRHTISNMRYRLNVGFKVSATYIISVYASQPGSASVDDPGRGNGAGGNGYVRYSEIYEVMWQESATWSICVRKGRE